MFEVMPLLITCSFVNRLYILPKGDFSLYRKHLALPSLQSDTKPKDQFLNHSPYSPCIRIDRQAASKQL